MQGHLDDARKRVSVLLEPIELIMVQEQELISPLMTRGIDLVLRLRVSASRTLPYVYRHAEGCDIILPCFACDELLRERHTIIAGPEYTVGVMTTMYTLESLK